MKPPPTDPVHPLSPSAWVLLAEAASAARGEPGPTPFRSPTGAAAALADAAGRLTTAAADADPRLLPSYWLHAAADAADRHDWAALAQAVAELDALVARQAGASAEAAADLDMLRLTVSAAHALVPAHPSLDA
jgi:hypothetical protein